MDFLYKQVVIMGCNLRVCQGSLGKGGWVLYIDYVDNRY